jgi:N-carbamoylputrescine amidase
MSTHLTVGLAQIDCRLGVVEANLERHLQRIAQAHEHNVDLLLFPELSLTGYRLLHLTSRVAIRIDQSSVVERLRKAAAGMSIIVGLVEEGPEGVLYNSALLIDREETRFVYRKLYLPTYGIFQEGRFFGAGDRLHQAPVGDEAVGVLICEDLWHPHLARRLALGGSRVIAVISAGPGRVGSGPRLDSQETWETLTRSTALVNTSWVLYCNRVGWEEGSFYSGGSHIVRPDGEVLCRAKGLAEELVIARIDLREVDRVRWRLPLLQASRSDIAGPE